MHEGKINRTGMISRSSKSSDDWLKEQVEDPVDRGIIETVSRDPLVGSTFDDRYYIVANIGGGGAANVYKARHLMINRWVALKVLDRSYDPNDERLRRFTREARSIAALDHPNIVRLYDFICSETQDPYLVMDYIEGDTLEKTIRIEKGLPLLRSLRIFAQICSALSYAHEQGVVHRDLKPSNIILTKAADGAEIARIVDFGLAKPVNSADMSDQAITIFGAIGDDITSPRQIVGTPLYMSPEQCMGSQHLDARTDVYSMGCLIFETLSGASPYGDVHAHEALRKHLESPPNSLLEVLPLLRSISNSEYVLLFLANQVIEKCLAKDPASRYQSMDELLQAILGLEAVAKRALESEEALSKRNLEKSNSPMERKHPRSIAIVTVVAAIILLLSMFVIYNYGSAFHF